MDRAPAEQGEQVVADFLEREPALQRIRCDRRPSSARRDNQGNRVHAT